MVEKKLRTITILLVALTLAFPGLMKNSARASSAVDQASAPDFVLTLSQTGLVKLKRGTGFILDRTITAVNGFNGTVTFQISGLPIGVTASSILDDGPVTGSGTSGIGIQSDKHNFQLGVISTVTVTGTSGTLSHSASFQMEVI